jgi:hypothetical protein
LYERVVLWKDARVFAFLERIFWSSALTCYRFGWLRLVAAFDVGPEASWTGADATGRTAATGRRIPKR